MLNPPNFTITSQTLSSSASRVGEKMMAWFTWLRAAYIWVNPSS